MNVLKRKSFWVISGLLLVSGLVIRFSKTAEFIAHFGSDRARTDLCRAIPRLSRGRQESILKLLLQDPVEDVRLACIAACARTPEFFSVDEFLERLLQAPSTLTIERSKAGEVLLARNQVRPSVLEYLKTNIKNEDFRNQCPRLAAYYFAHELANASLEDRQFVINYSLDENDPACEYFQKLILERTEYFLPWRECFADDSKAGLSSQGRKFRSSACSAMEICAQNLQKNDSAEPGDPETQDKFTAFNAAWVQQIKPNYQIAEFKNKLCLTLGEGAGGMLHWLKGEDGTVDVGEAFFSLYAPRDADYQLWVQAYFDDKCGNSFGIWLDDIAFVNFNDDNSLFREWHWLPLHSRGIPKLTLKKGFHKGRLQAWEDGVYIAMLALVPVGIYPDRLDPKPKVHWDRSLPSSLSFTTEYQSAFRGSTQTVTIWVRRNSPALTGGNVHIRIPPPFVIAESMADKIVHFNADSPLASATFRIRLPSDAVVGEEVLHATYTDVSGKGLNGEIILGGQFDWMTTGPLDPGDARQIKLSQMKEIGDEDLKAGWSRYPQKGIDPYRRLNLEWAYGGFRNKFIYLCTDINVGQSGDFMAMLTADDTAIVFIDGKRVIEQSGDGPGEGRLVTSPLYLDRGPHRIFARVFQSDAPIPEGPDRYSHTWNHCIFKLLLRKKQHQQSETIQGLPHGAIGAATPHD